mmetsp:Transcript_51455/g.164757  ORF Transcript_51455/g.164757 Transcript_51455/m.164757 type:complete len:204 (+) Transcript_51455:1871-2482(+)
MRGVAERGQGVRPRSLRPRARGLRLRGLAGLGRLRQVRRSAETLQEHHPVPEVWRCQLRAVRARGDQQLPPQVRRGGLLHLGGLEVLGPVQRAVRRGPAQPPALPGRHGRRRGPVAQAAGRLRCLGPGGGACGAAAPAREPPGQLHPEPRAGVRRRLPELRRRALCRSRCHGLRVAPASHIPGRSGAVTRQAPGPGRPQAQHG